MFSTTGYSSFAEPEPTLFAPLPPEEDGLAAAAERTPAIQNKNDTKDTDAPLRSDIRVMGSVLGQVIGEQHEGRDIFDKVEHMRSLAKTWRQNKTTITSSSSSSFGGGEGCDDNGRDATAFAALAEYASRFHPSELYAVSRAFTHFLAIANAAERHHRSRRLRDAAVKTVISFNNNNSNTEATTTTVPTSSGGALWPKKDSCGGVIPDLLSQGHSPETIWQALSTQTTELVLTAHPTEVNRRTLLEKKRRIQKILTVADQYRAVGQVKDYDLKQLDQAMYREISSIWQSDEVSRTKPTPILEAEKGTLVLETVLWEAVPQFLRKLDATCHEFLNKGLPLTAAPVRFASWMGGDRDGNPNVVPSTTRQVCLHNRRKAAQLFQRDLRTLESELSITTCSNELRQLLGDTDDAVTFEPYRAFIRPMLHKLQRTQDWADQEIEHMRGSETVAVSAPWTKSHSPTIQEHDIYLSKDEFMNDLLAIFRSLCSTGNDVEADGILTDIIRNVSAFGLTLIPLDVRQESDRHEEALDAITRFLGLGSFAQWDEETRISWLTTQISSRRPLIRSGVWRDYPDIFSETAVDTLEIFQMIADQHEDSLGAYVISQATSASDVLSVLLLQLDAGVKKPLRVAPLFESLDDLNGAAATMKKLFSLPVYMGIINGRQEVMIGYSDSAKDAGRYVELYQSPDKESRENTVFLRVNLLILSRCIF